MYHDTIHIHFKSLWDSREVDFEYSFFISKDIKTGFTPISYSILSQQFDEIGFDLKYLKFYDIDDDAIVYCSYNYQPKFEIFFSAYRKLIQYRHFHITFEYGNIIFGKFYPNNMNYFAGVSFISNPIDRTNLYQEEIIKGKTHFKSKELYQLVDKNGEIVAIDIADPHNDFEQHFFERHEVKVALRKYKLSRLKTSFNENL